MSLRTVLPPVVVAVLGLGALSAVQDTGFRERIESDLTERAQGALSAARLYEADVEITGRDADVTAPTALEAIEAADVVSGVDGIRVAAAYGPDGPVSADAGETESSLSQSSPASTAVVDVGDVASAEATLLPEPTETPSDDANGDAEAESDGPRRTPTSAEREMAQQDLVEIPNITFVTDSARLTRDGRRVVREAAEVLEEHPEVEVRIEGHTDSRGSETHNRRLSERRADEVLDRLAELGVDHDRLTSEGYGESDPLVVPRTFADLEKNRRVELIVQD
ncbi:Outer membrane protein OmpA [Promicromonospora umidemergens]|uniref:OmpA-like domain-containing protein n=1 Tax=Promicromonospora umidemergens TaxID=629679 RepID=A0ABP8X9M2_9MICO|nr:OmpA family protein [Promicromonospora umidemergens]MCP2281334.1 Outer membrane protein OmpA [Promicromonospora umidemergens]